MKFLDVMVQKLELTERKWGETRIRIIIIIMIIIINTKTIRLPPSGKT